MEIRRFSPISAVMALGLALGSRAPASAQEAAPPTASGVDAVPEWADPVEVPAGGSSGPAFGPSGPAFEPEAMPARVVMGPLEVIHESLFGAASKEDWHPLSLSTFFTEGWDEPFVKSPEGTNGAPKQNWTGAATGIFGRFQLLNFYYTDHMTTNKGLFLTAINTLPTKPRTNGNDYAASYNIYLPLNQRMEVLLAIPFIADNRSSPAGHYVGNFGDLAFHFRFRLIEQRNFSMLAYLGERAPTGKFVNGNGLNVVSPFVEAWWNFAPRWVARGATGININTGTQRATNVLATNLAVGRYLTTRDARVFKELVVYTSVFSLTDVAGRAGYLTDVYIQPGFRFGLDRGGKWYALAGVQVPVAGPRPYDWQPNFSLVKAY